LPSTSTWIVPDAASEAAGAWFDHVHDLVAFASEVRFDAERR